MYVRASRSKLRVQSFPFIVDALPTLKVTSDDPWNHCTLTVESLYFNDAVTREDGSYLSIVDSHIGTYVKLILVVSAPSKIFDKFISDYVLTGSNGI